MKIGYIGLGRMGKNMVLRLLEKGIEVVAWNRSPEPLEEVSVAGAEKAKDPEDLVNKLPSPKVVWLMLPSGDVTNEFADKLSKILSKDDIVIDGSNSFYKNSLALKKKLNKFGIHYMDAGVSGGVEGARNGACLMVGGSKEDFKKTENIFKAAASDNAYRHVGNSGAGHFVKMVHNGIEYGMMGALAEGMAALGKYKKDLSIDIKDAAYIYAKGSIIEGKLATLLEKVVNRPDFETTVGTVPKGETEDEMEKLEKLSDMPLLKQARKMRVRSRKKESFEGKVLALLRNEFGGHALTKK